MKRQRTQMCSILLHPDVLKLNKSLYGLKQGSNNWFEKLKKGSIDRQFSQSQVDPCVFMGSGCIVMTYVDDCIIIADAEYKIDNLIKSMHGGKEKFVFTDEGSIDKYLGVDIHQLDNEIFEMTQPFLRYDTYFWGSTLF